MDKKRLLTFSSFSLYGFTLFFLTVAILLWWFFFYQPLLAQIIGYKQSNLIARAKIAQEDSLNNELLRAQGEVLYLGLKKREVFDSKGFSEDNLSQELLNLVAATGATISFFRVKPWRERNERISCEVEIAITGSYAGCCAFLKNISARSGKVLSCSLAPKEDNIIELTGAYKLYACNNKAVKKETMFAAKDFESLQSIFYTPIKQGEKKQISKDNPAINSFPVGVEKASRSAWLNLEDVPQVEHQAKLRNYRIRQINRNTVVV